MILIEINYGGGIPFAVSKLDLIGVQESDLMSVHLYNVSVPISLVLMMHRQVRVRRRPLTQQECSGQDVKQDDFETRQIHAFGLFGTNTVECTRSMNYTRSQKAVPRLISAHLYCASIATLINTFWNANHENY